MEKPQKLSSSNHSAPLKNSSEAGDPEPCGLGEEAEGFLESMHVSGLIFLSLFFFQLFLVTQGHIKRIGYFQRQAPESSVLAELFMSYRDLEEVYFL